MRRAAGGRTRAAMDRLRSLSIHRAVEASCRRPGLILLTAALLCAIAAYYAISHFDMTSDTAQLISSKVPWRQNEIAMDRAFPQDADTTVIVLDGATPEIAEVAAARLSDALQPHRDVIRGVRRPDGGPFFDREGLLLLSTAQVQSATEQLSAAQPFLGALAGDPSLRGVMSTLSTLATGVEQGQTTLGVVGKPIGALANTLQTVETGQPAFFSWQVLLGSGASTAPLRRFVIVQPRLDFGGLTPGVGASDLIRHTATQLGLDQRHGVRVRLTGSIPLSDEEFASLADRLWRVGDLGSRRRVRFGAGGWVSARLSEALVAGAGGIGRSVVLAAAAIALGFCAFLPTNYVGVSELGVIAGLGMGIGLILNLTLLPALLMLLKPPPQPREVRSRLMAPVDRFLISHRKLVLWAFAGSTVVSAALLPLVRFDFNPFHLRNIHGEAMSTLADIMRDPDHTPNTIDVLTPSLADADRLAALLSKLPPVDPAATLSSFLPHHQAT